MSKAPLVLVDSSVWIDYFRGTGIDDRLDGLMEEGQIVTNDLVLAGRRQPVIIRPCIFFIGRADKSQMFSSGNIAGVGPVQITIRIRVVIQSVQLATFKHPLK